ncbi:5910_t:CDS:2, partial [Dentiscutata heterogama]
NNSETPKNNYKRTAPTQKRITKEQLQIAKKTAPKRQTELPKNNSKSPRWLPKKAPNCRSELSKNSTKTPKSKAELIVGSLGKTKAKRITKEQLQNTKVNYQTAQETYQITAPKRQTELPNHQ